MSLSSEKYENMILEVLNFKGDEYVGVLDDMDDFEEDLIEIKF